MRIVNLGRLQNGDDEPPNQSVKGKQIEREKGVGNQAAQKETNLHDFPRSHAVSDHGAEDDNSKRRKPNQPRRFDKTAQNERKGQRKSKGQNSGNQDEGKFGPVT